MKEGAGFSSQGSGVTILVAEWVAPIDSPIIHRGAVAISGNAVLAVGESSEILTAYPGQQINDLGRALLLPGLVNPHTHLELSGCDSGESPDGSFVQWILNVRKRNMQPDATAAARLGIAQCLRFGVTCIGDISQRVMETRAALVDSPLRAVSYGEVLGLGGLRARFDELLPAAINQQHASPKLQIGLTPHAPYTVDIDGFRRCLELARGQSLPLATHLAETPDEREFLTSNTGSFRWVWEQLGTWQDNVPKFDGGPIEMAKSIGLLDYPTLLAHVNYCDDPELEMLSRGNANVVYCPRTHRYFGHPPHRWREMLARGINVAVGTDSCASSPDLNIVDDLRLLRGIAPEVPAATLWEMATIRAARAIGWEDEVGSIASGKHADFVVFDIDGDDPLNEILNESRLPRETWIAGERLTLP